VQAFQGTLLGADEPRVTLVPVFERIELGRGSWIDVSRGWLHGADTLLDDLAHRIDWRQGRRWMYDQMRDDPRLSRFFPRGAPAPHPACVEVRASLEDHYGESFGGWGLNYYRDGRDSVAWHSDRELRHLDRTLVVIVTLGAARPFLIRPRGGGRSTDIHPGSGDLLVMGGRAQADWEHAVPKVATAGPRISVMLRWTAGPTTRDETVPAAQQMVRPMGDTGAAPRR
jgi:alkylated DNA repair dioxygenase AlkB